MQTKAGFTCHHEASSVAETARHILRAQLRVMESNAERATRLHSAKAIHDLRLAIRRFRAALRIFGGLMPDMIVKRLRRRLLVLNRQLGPIRDAQVWLGLLTRTVGRRERPLPAEWVQCVKMATETCATRVKMLDQALKSAPFWEAHECCNHLQCDKPCGDQAVRPFLAAKLQRAYVRLFRIGAPVAGATGEDVHAFRRHYRRARYLSEFTEPLLGEPVDKLTHYLKRVSTALGERHDVEVQIQILTGMKKPPKDLFVMLDHKKHAAQQDFDTAWKKLMAPHFRKHVRTNLRVVKRAGK